MINLQTENEMQNFMKGKTEQEQIALQYIYDLCETNSKHKNDPEFGKYLNKICTGKGYHYLHEEFTTDVIDPKIKAGTMTAVYWDVYHRFAGIVKNVLGL